MEINILDSINNLLKQVRDVADFVCTLSRLFCVIKNRASRVELCKIFATIKDLQPAFSIISQLTTSVKLKIVFLFKFNRFMYK